VRHACISVVEEIRSRIICPMPCYDGEKEFSLRPLVIIVACVDLA